MIAPFTPEEAAERAEHRAKLYKRLKGCGVGCLMPIVTAVLFAFFLIGYGMGYFDGLAGRPTIFQKESNDVQ